MDEYFVLLFSVSILLFLYELIKKNIFLVLIFLILTFFAGFRYYVGIDYKVYESMFGYVDLTDSVTKEPGFTYLFSLIKETGFNVQVFFLLFATLTQFFIYKSIKTLSNDKMLSVLIYVSVLSFYLYSFNAVRQTLATAIFMYSLMYVYNGNLKKFIATILFTGFFVHLSVLLFLPIYFFCRKKYKNNFKLILSLSFFILGLMVKYLIAFTGYSVYLEIGDEFETKVTLKIYFFLIVSILIELYGRRIYNKNFITRVYLNLNLLGIGLLLIVITQDNSALILLFKRLHNYILLSYIFIVPNIISQLKVNNQGKKLLKLGMIIVLILSFINTIINKGEKLQIVPYNTNYKIY